MGEGFLKWVKLLLNGTSACACVNGFVSRQVPTTGGVRQGCPLSPFLFLFISQAMLCLLKARGFGIDVGGRRITATAFADDTQPYLSDIFADTQVFRSVMQQFADASGEALNFDKSYLLPIGKEARVALWQQHFLPLVRQELPAAATEAEVVHEAHRRARQQFLLDGASVPEGQRIAGFKVVAQAAALGMLFNAKGHVSVDWESRLANVKGVFSYVSSLGLSVFGRAFAAAGYGISKLLYAAEYAGLPPQRILDELSRLQAKLVDRGLAPDTPGQHFAGVRAGLLPGHPKYGGFGAMPWKEHILGRHAMWGVRLMLGSDDTPWVYVARHLLGGNRQCPTFATLGIAMCTDAVLGPDGRHLCPALTRLAQGLQALPAWEDGAAEPLQPGPWCHSMPLWCNPFVMGQGAPGALPRRGLEAEFGDIAQLPTISTVGKARTALRAIEGACRPGEGPRLFQAEVWPNFLCSNALFQDRQHALERFTALLAAIPSCWTDAITNRDRGDVKEVLQDRLLPRLLWRLPGSNYGVLLSRMRVRQATRAQLGPLLAARGEKQVAFLQEAYAGAAPSPAQLDAASLYPVFQQLWSLPWENSRKEVYWRLTLDGLPTAARMHQGEGEPCNCGTRLPGRPHHFWECPVAQAVVGELQRVIGPQAPQLSRAQVWLLQAPQGIHGGVWGVVCLAAIIAMEKGRKLLTKWRLAGGQAGGAQQGARRGAGQQRPPPPLAQRLPAASRLAVATIWDCLQDFVGLGLAPAPWVAEVAADHPFLHSVAQPGGGHALRLHRV